MVNKNLVMAISHSYNKEELLDLLQKESGVASIPEKLYKMDLASIKRIGRRAARKIQEIELTPVIHYYKNQERRYWKDEKGFFHYTKEEAYFSASLEEAYLNFKRNR